MNWVDWVAIYGALLSTFIGVWTIYYNLLDRPKVEVDAKFGFLDYGAGDLSETKLIVTAVNKGRRSVTLSSMGMRLEDNQDLIHLKTQGLPRELGEGKSHSEWFKVEDLRNVRGLFVWFRDQTGKIYRSKSINYRLKNYFESGKNGTNNL